ncbi:MAG: hypothetical protein AB8G16_19510 [Gammaproteobacteria bacterium]
MPTMIADGLSARGCQRCEGALVDLVAYRAWAEQQGIDTMSSPGEANTPVDDSRQAVQCPHCERIMTKFKVSSNTDNRLDFCNHCDAAWLDGGEWNQLQEMGLRSHLGSVFSEPWQRRVRESTASRLSEQHLQARFGADFEKIKAFKTWLQSRPDRDDIVGWIAFSSNDG